MSKFDFLDDKYKAEYYFYEGWLRFLEGQYKASFEHLNFSINHSDDDSWWTEIFTYLIPLKLMFEEEISVGEKEKFT